MPHRLRPRQPPTPRASAEGFALIGVLGILLAASVLVGTLLLGTLGRARDAAAGIDQLRLENAAESAAHQMLAAPPIALLRTGRVQQSVLLDGHRVEVSAQLCEGLVRLRSPSASRERLLARALGGESIRVAASLDRLEAQGALLSWAQVAALPGVGPAGLRKLLPQASLFADPGEPAAGARTPPGPVDVPPSHAIGRLIQVQARASKNGRHSPLLLIEARLTGQQPRPLWVHDWLWADTGPPAQQ